MSSNSDWSTYPFLFVSISIIAELEIKKKQDVKINFQLHSLCCKLYKYISQLLDYLFKINIWLYTFIN